MDVIREGDPVGRRDHQCVWCGEKIPAGEKHHQQVGRVYEELQDNRYHEECFEVASVGFAEGDCDFSMYSAPRPVRVTTEKRGTNER
jgi:hypothetical protein